MKDQSLTVLLLLALVWISPCIQAQDIGPKERTLLLGGGSLQDIAIFERFVAHAGGPDAHIVVIPTAGGQPSYDQYWQGLNILRRAGAQHLTILYTYDHEEGLVFLKNTAVDQHLLQRNRQFDLIEIIDPHPQLMGIGIDENTAILVRGHQFEVIGQSYVAIYDHKLIARS